MTQTSLETLGREWQTRLNLNNWSIVFHLVDQDAIEECYGTNNYFSPALRSDVSILDPADNTSDNPGDPVYIPEVTLVHELLHLTVSQLDPSQELLHITEQTIETLAVALVSAKYGQVCVREFYPFYES